MSKKLAGGCVIVEALKAAGIDTVFGIPAVHNLDIYDALRDEPSIRHVAARHEQGAGFMADGYARAKGDIGVLLTSSGPGAGFAVVPMAMATTDGSAVLHITAEVSREFLGRGKGTLHEGVDHLGLMKACSLRALRVVKIGDITHAIFGEISALRSGPAGAVSLEFPFDLQCGEAEVEVPRYRDVSVRRQPNEKQIAEAAGLLAAAKRPVIWAGGGVIAAEATGELKQVAELLKCPVINGVMGQGAFAADHPQHLGNIAAESSVRELLSRCDVMLAAGTHIRAMDSDGWNVPFPDTLVHLDADADRIGRNVPAIAPIHADARLGLAALTARVGTNVASEWDLREIAEARTQAWADARSRAPDEIEVLEQLRAGVPRDALVYCDRTSIAYWASRFWPVYHPRSFFYGMGYATLGCAIPSAIGGKVARPDRQVAAIVGDGGFMYTCAELATAIQFGIHIVVLLFNDDCYAAVKDIQSRRFGGRTMADQLVNPDFQALARSFGMDAMKVDDVADVAPTLEKVFSRKLERSVLIEMPFALEQPEAKT